MTSVISLEEEAAQVRDFIERTSTGALNPVETEAEFNRLALELFALQTEQVPVYRDVCRKRGLGSVTNWRDIPALPVTAFRAYDVSSLSAEDRRFVFHSSGTTRQQPSRHFHSEASRALYETSLRAWFRPHFPPAPRPEQLIVLTPTAAQAPRSSLAHMFDTIQADFPGAKFTGSLDADGAWDLDLPATLAALAEAEKSGGRALLLGTAFSFVSLLEYGRAHEKRFRLPPGSRALETGGYKGRGRDVAKAELRQMITRHLGIPATQIVGEYGMCELSSQAYDRVAGAAEGPFQFPPWARARLVSPETGREVAEGETGLIQVFDLANVWSVLAVQTEDLGVRRGGGFELAGRAAAAAARGCSRLVRDL